MLCKVFYRIWEVNRYWQKKVIPKMPEHKCYGEVFAGAAWMLFKKEESGVEIINDINHDLVTLYRVVKHHIDEFTRYFRYILIARDEFERFLAENSESLTDIQRAARFYYLLKTGYASKVYQQNFSVSTVKKSRINLLRLEEELSEIHLRLSRVYIENMPYQRCIEKYDRPHTFFYVDPPYYGCEDYYGKSIFCRDDFVKLRDLLSSIKGMFIMSINDVDEIRRLYREFIIEEVETTYHVSNKKKVVELLIRNY
ncbi:DNA adenine methylase [Candidatus Magnetominusculus xianensis]|uniref:DNA adenine methylase n=1 Tax=Candidatus Magnetominusculus xianensis TaxID=1748249 RepID=UPI001F02D362|nr:DNA adenine methylase [Candidatus Magnetominusculus xianensis]